MKADELAKEYLEISEVVKTLETRQSEIREELKGLLRFAEVTDPKTWPLGPAVAVWVKGRVSKILDRSKLVQLGVTAAVLDAATVTTVGGPSLRITAAEGPKE